MHLKKTKRNGRVYLSVVQNYREGGTTKTRTIETIGYADAYADEFADPLAHFEAYVAELNARRRAQRAPIEFAFPRECTIDANHTESARWGAAIALAYLDALEAKRGIPRPADESEARDACDVRNACGIQGAGTARSARNAVKKKGRNGTAATPSEQNPAPSRSDASAARRALEVFAAERMLHASPKHETWERRDSFPRPCDFPIDEAYRVLPVIAANDERIARTMRAAYERIRPDHAPLACAYVVLGTFVFDDTDDVDSARRQQARGQTAVGLAMVLDEDGIPAGYRLIEADPDEAALCALAADVKATLGARRIVVVAGRLSRAVAAMKALAAAGDGFIMHRSLETAVEDMRHWAADEKGYTTSRSGNYRIKSRVRTATVEIHEVGRSITGTHDDGRHKAAPSGGAAPQRPFADSIDATGGGRARGNLKRSAKGSDAMPGEKPAKAEGRLGRETSSIRVRVRDIVFWGRDYALRRQGGRPDAESDELDGYACIVTSETGLGAPEVFHLYRELWRLAEPFQVLESDFSPSPYPTPRDEHIRAHFAICYAAFFAMRLMRSDLHWRYNAAQVADALMRMEGGHLAENWFLFGYRSPVSDAIEQAAGVNAALRLRTKQDIREGIAQARRRIRREEANPES